MKQIPLTRGLFAMVDDQDFHWLSERKWCAQDGRNGRWRAVSRDGKKILVMHRVIVEASAEFLVDHINGNPLDNRRENLRVCSYKENARNLKIERRVIKTSQFKGVCWSKLNRNWTAQITVNYKKVHLGCFKTEQMAAFAYDEAAIRYFGAFAKLNVLVP